MYSEIVQTRPGFNVESPIPRSSSRPGVKISAVTVFSWKQPWYQRGELQTPQGVGHCADGDEVKYGVGR